MKKLKITKEITRVSTGYNEVVYITEELLRNDIIIIDKIDDESDKLKSFITIYVIYNNEALMITMYEGRLLNELESYGIIKNIIDIKKENSTDDFIEIMRKLSTVCVDSGMLNDDFKKEIYTKVESRLSEMRNEKY